MISTRTRNVIITVLLVIGVLSVVVLLSGCEPAGSHQDPCNPTPCVVPSGVTR